MSLSRTARRIGLPAHRHAASGAYGRSELR
jgi:hypothetical protein